MAVLELFNGTQPDYHIGMRSRCVIGMVIGLGKSVSTVIPILITGVDLTAHAYRECRALAVRSMFIRRRRLTEVLSMFRADGSAACAYVIRLR